MIMSNLSCPMMMEMPGIFLPHLKEAPQSLTQQLRKVEFLMFLVSFKHRMTCPFSLGFTFSEVNCWRTSNSKIVCCNFSYDGKILASAGHEKKVCAAAILW
jgi:hypothetical protein